MTRIIHSFFVKSPDAPRACKNDLPRNPRQSCIKTYAIAAALLLTQCIAHAAALPAPPCGRTYGGAHRDVPQSVIATHDGGFIVAGYSDSFSVDQGDVWLVKVDVAGNVQWERALGGADWDSAMDIALTPDNGFLLAGITATYRINVRGMFEVENMNAVNEDYFGDLWLQKLNVEGQPEWTRTLGRAGDDNAAAVEVSAAGAAVTVAGAWTADNMSDLWRADLAPGDDWPDAAAYGGRYRNRAFAVRRAAGGDSVLAGASPPLNPEDPSDVWVSVIDAEGRARWSAVFGGDREDRAVDVRPTPDGGLVIAAASRSAGAGALDYFVIKTGADGSKQWTQAYGGKKNDVPQTILPTADGGYIVAGASASYSRGDTDVWILKLGADGTRQWGRNYGGRREDRAADILATPGGGWLIAAVTRSFGSGWYDYWLFKIDATGNCAWPPDRK